MLRLFCLVMLSGCYAAVRPTISAPVGHGHGGAGAELGLSGGVEHFDTRLRAGGGIDFGPRLANHNGFVPFALEAHIAIAVGGKPYGDRWRPLIVAHSMFGFASGLPQSGDTTGPDSPSGYLARAFVGFALGATTTQRDYRVNAGHEGFGLMATRFWPEAGDPFWMLGAGFDVSFGLWQPR